MEEAGLMGVKKRKFGRCRSQRIKVLAHVVEGTTPLPRENHRRRKTAGTTREQEKSVSTNTMTDIIGDIGKGSKCIFLRPKRHLSTKAANRFCIARSVTSAVPVSEREPAPPPPTPPRGSPSAPLAEPPVSAPSLGLGALLRF